MTKEPETWETNQRERETTNEKNMKKMRNIWKDIQKQREIKKRRWKWKVCDLETSSSRRNRWTLGRDGNVLTLKKS